MDFSTLNKEQLRDECVARNLGVSGTNVELVDRLTAYEASKPPADDEDLLSDLGDEPPVVTKRENPPIPTTPETPVTDSTDPKMATPADIDVPEPEDPRVLPGNRFEMLFACPSELSTGVHQDNLERTWQAAAEANYNPRGGAYGATRTGFRTVDGKRHAVYEIGIRP